MHILAERKTILSVPVDTHSPDTFLSRILQAALGSETKTVFAINAEKIMRARRDPDLFKALQDSDFLIPDGIGAVIGLWLKYGVKIPRTTGVDLMGKLLKMAAEKNLRVFLFGADPDINPKASSKIKEMYPTLPIVGSQHGYIPEAEYDDLLSRINNASAHILFVGLGSPKQEKWIHEHKEKLKVKICMGVGGSLDVLSGRTALAPRFFRKAGLEWFYRLISEPRRLKRQIVLPMFLLAIVKDRFFSGT